MKERKKERKVGRTKYEGRKKEGRKDYTKEQKREGRN